MPTTSIKLSIVIPAKDKADPKLAELLRSIEAQDFPKDEMEVLVITEGTSESAKAIGIRRAKGEVIGIFASDNQLLQSSFLDVMYRAASKYSAAYPVEYAHVENDDILNRYFALIGGNDPLSFYMNKNDRISYENRRASIAGSVGDNGFFIQKHLIEKTDLNNYYHIDNAQEAIFPTNVWPITGYPIWHKTGGNLFKFLAKRFRYGLQHAFNPNRRWHLVDFRNQKDIVRLLWFIVASFTLLHPFLTSVKGFLKIRDIAWFLHPVMCLLTVLNYGILVLVLTVNRLIYPLSSVPTVAQRA